MNEVENDTPLDVDGGIFDNKEDVVGNIKSAAENVGLPAEAVENIDKEEAKKVYYAKKSCSWCGGRGLTRFVPNGVFVSSRRKEPSKAFLRSVNMTPKKLGRSVQRLTALTSGKVKMGRDTRLKEEWKNAEWYEQHMTKALCKCVRVVEEV